MGSSDRHLKLGLDIGFDSGLGTESVLDNDTTRDYVLE